MGGQKMKVGKITLGQSDVSVGWTILRDESDGGPMQLPDGKCCEDCKHWKRCKWLISTLTGKETKCDFYPSRFGIKDDRAMGKQNNSG